MKRFIRYLYEYEHGRRLRNVGFVKAEQNENECTLHIHGKGLHMKGERKLTVYLFFKAGEGCAGIWQGTIDNVNPAINYRLYYQEEDVGGAENFQKINGIILESEMGHKYAAVWDEAAVDIGNMRVLNLSPERDIPQEESEYVRREEAGEQSDPAGKEERKASPGPDREEGQQESPGLNREEGQKASPGSDREEGRKASPGPDREEGQQESPGLNREEGQQESPGPDREEGQQESLGSDRGEGQRESPGSDREEEPQKRQEFIREEKQGENPKSAIMQDSFEPENLRKADAISQEACKQDDEQSKAPRNSCQCTKILRNDLARLPRCEWKWANNSFLLHGYYNYHHLALIHDGNRFLLGVPGIYHPQEAKAAGVFGFTEFIPAQDMEVDLTDDEKDSRDQFGYWCRPVKKPLKM